MKLSEVYAILDKVAPKALSDEFCAQMNGYDNSGVLVDCGEEIKGILFSLDLTSAAIAEAKKVGANLIVTHHPAIYGKIGNILSGDESSVGDKLVKCLRCGISVVSMHLNLDSAVGGIDESLMQGICLAAGGAKGEKVEKLFALSEGGYGRVYDVQETTLGTLAKNISKEFTTERVVTYGAEDRKIGRVASFCGAGGDERGVAFAKACNADVIVSSDFKHHVITMAQESGLAIITLTHYASEHYGFVKYYNKIRQQVDLPCVYHTDEYLL